MYCDITATAGTPAAQFWPKEFLEDSDSDDSDSDDENNPQYDQFYSLSNYYNKVTVTKKSDVEEG